MNFKKTDKEVPDRRLFFVQKGQTNMTKTTLYHGSTQQFTAFDLDHLGQNGTAQGAGIYTTPDQEVAAMYAQLTDEPGYIYQVASDLKNPLSLERVTVSDQELSKIVDQLHKETDLLSNYGDVEYSGYSLVKDEALELLRENDNDVDLFNDLALTSGDPQITAEAFETAGDYTHIVSHDQTRLNSDVYTILNPKNVEIKTVESANDYMQESHNQIKTVKEANQHMTIDASATIYNGDFHQEVEDLVHKNYQNTKIKTNELEPGVYHETLQFDVDGRQRQLTMLYGEQNKVALGMDQLSENGATTLKIGGDQQGGQIIKDLLDSPQLAGREVTFTPNDVVQSEMDYHSPNRTKRADDQSIGIE